MFKSPQFLWCVYNVNFFRMVLNAYTLLNTVAVIFVLCMPYVMRCAILGDERGNPSVPGKRSFDFYLSCYGMVLAFYTVVLFISVSGWFLSQNGTDSPTCGNNQSNACKTLDQLLERFYNASYKKNQTLVLHTDFSIIINNNLTVSRFYIL